MLLQEESLRNQAMRSPAMRNWSQVHELSNSIFSLHCQYIISKQVMKIYKIRNCKTLSEEEMEFACVLPEQWNHFVSWWKHRFVTRREMLRNKQDQRRKQCNKGQLKCTWYEKELLLIWQAFKIQRNGVFCFGISFFVYANQTFYHFTCLRGGGTDK